MPDLYSSTRRANSQYVPQYIGSNTDTIKSVADTLQLRSLQNQNAIDDKLVAAINEQYAPGDEAIGQKIYEDISGMRDQIASSDQGFENSTGLVRNLVRDKFLTNRDRIEGLRNKKQYDVHQEMLRQLGANAVDFTEPFKGTVNEDGTYNRYTPRVEKAEPILKTKEELFDNFHADSIKDNFAVGKGDLADFLVARQTGGISNTKVENYANKALLRYKETPSYKQEQRIYKRDNPNLSNSEIDEKIKTSLLATGAERVFGIQDQDLQRLYQLKDRQGDPLTTPPSGYEEGVGIPYKLPEISTKLNRTGLSIGQALNPVVQRYNNFRKSEKTGDYIINGKVVPATPVLDKNYKDLADQYNNYLKENKIGEYPELTGQDKTDYDNIAETLIETLKRSKNSKTANEIEKDKYGDKGHDLVNKYFTDLKSKELADIPRVVRGDFIRREEEGRSTAADATEDLKRTYNFRNFVKLSDPSVVLSGSQPDFLSKIGVEDYEAFLKSMEVVGEYSPQNMFPKMTGNEGFTDPLAVRINGEMYAVDRSASERKGPLYEQRKQINKLYTAAKRLPGIKSTVEVRNNEGEKMNLIIQEHNGGFVLEEKGKGNPVWYESLEELFRP